MPGDLFCRDAAYPGLQIEIRLFIKEFVAGLLHFINKIRNFKYRTKTVKTCKTTH